MVLQYQGGASNAARHAAPQKPEILPELRMPEPRVVHRSSEILLYCAVLGSRLVCIAPAVLVHPHPGPGRTCLQGALVNICTAAQLPGLSSPPLLSRWDPADLFHGMTVKRQWKVAVAREKGNQPHDCQDWRHRCINVTIGKHQGDLLILPVL